MSKLNKHCAEVRGEKREFAAKALTPVAGYACPPRKLPCHGGQGNLEQKAERLRDPF